MHFHENDDNLTIEKPLHADATKGRYFAAIITSCILAAQYVTYTDAAS
jgi:hypothetical protein